jgi:hypothetical protein
VGLATHFLFMSDILKIPEVEIAIGADYMFRASQATDLLGLIDFSALAGSVFTVEIYSLVYPTGTVDDTLTGAKVASSDVDFYAIFTDTLTGAYTDGDQRWAKLILNAGTDAQAVGHVKLVFRGK